MFQAASQQASGAMVRQAVQEGRGSPGPGPQNYSEVRELRQDGRLTKDRPTAPKPRATVGKGGDGWDSRLRATSDAAIDPEVLTACSASTSGQGPPGARAVTGSSIRRRVADSAAGPEDAVGSLRGDCSQVGLDPSADQQHSSSQSANNAGRRGATPTIGWARAGGDVARLSEQAAAGCDHADRSARLPSRCSSRARGSRIACSRNDG